MINETKLKNAFYAMQGIAIQARFLTLGKKEEERQMIVSLLDALDDMTRMLASEIDETERFHWRLREVGEKNKCAYVIKRFEEELPEKW